MNISSATGILQKARALVAEDDFRSYFGREFFQKQLVYFAEIGLLPIFAIFSLWLMARLVWALWPPAEIKYIELMPSLAISQAGPADDAPPDTGTLIELDLFGVKKTESAAEPQDTGPPPLSIVLTGIIYSPDTVKARASFRHKTEEKLYKINGELPDNMGVLLGIEKKQVIIKRPGGELQTLRLFEDKKEKAPATEADVVVDNRNKPAVQQLFNKYYKILVNAPQQLGTYVRVTPSRTKEGLLEGYRIFPKKDGRSFRKMGLKNNDIITNINGITINSIAGAQRAHSAISGARELRLRVLRGKQRQNVDLLFSIE